MIGATLGAYRVAAELGSGGMGTVYRAQGPDGAVALKVVHPHLVADAVSLARFRREAELGASVRHRNVVATLASGETDGRHWLALEYVEGQTLHALQVELGTVPEELCRHVAHEVAAGLAAIHAAGIVHRDLKPENVLITRDHVVKVMDLGVARGAADDTRLTQTGVFVGSLQYAAPEQLSGDDHGIDGRADLHALGVVLYEISTGTSPYQDTDWRRVLHRVRNESPRRLGAVSPQVSPFFEELVHTLLAKGRVARFASAAELVAVLEEGEASSWWSARATAIRGSTKRPLRRVQIPRDTALVGRSAELATLRSLFERASQGEGQVVLVEGEAGIGKSRLVDEFVALLRSEGHDLDFLYGSYPPGGAATASGAFATAYREHFGEEDLATALGACLKETPLLVPGFAALLTSHAPPQGALALTKEAIQACFVRATRALAAERVVIVLVDDLHFAPDEGRALFASLAMAAPGRRILLVGTSRPPIDEKWTASIVLLGHTTRMAVGRLGPKDLATLLREALKSSHLAEELAFKIAEKTDGNPFLVFEVLRGLKDGQYLTQRPDGTWATTRMIREIRIPSSIADLIQARVGDLGEGERSLLEIAACAGFEFDAALVCDVAGLARIPALRTLGTIEKSHRLIRAAGRRYVFDHHQVQEHLYGGLSQFVREGYHAAIAESLERVQEAADKDPAALDGALCANLCDHFLKGGHGQRALRYLDRALTHLAQRFLNEAAAALADRALAAPSVFVGAERARLLMRQVGWLELCGRRGAELAALDEARALADASGDPELRAESRAKSARALSLAGRQDDALLMVDEAFALARAAGARKIETDALVVLGHVVFSRSRFEEATVHLRALLERAHVDGDVQAQAGALGNIAVCQFNLGLYDESIENYRRSIDLCVSADLRRSEATYRGNYANALFSLGLFERCLDEQLRSLELQRSIGSRRGEAVCLVNLGTLDAALGDPVRARDQIVASAALSREVTYPFSEGYALAGLATLALDAGRPAEADRPAEELRELRERIGHAAGVAESLHVLGRVRAAMNDVAGARSLFEKSLALAREIGLPGAVVAASVSLAELPGGDAFAAAETFAENEAKIGVHERMSARFALWRATDERAHLAEAKRHLDFLVANAPEPRRGAMLSEVRLHREIAAAATSAGL